MIECPPFVKDTPIYYAMLHIIYFLSTFEGIFVVAAIALKCPKNVKTIKVQLILMLSVGNIAIFMPTEGNLIVFIFYCRFTQIKIRF